MIIPAIIELPEIAVGRSWEVSFTITIDITGYSARLQIREGESTLSNLVIEPTLVLTPGATSTIAATITAANSAALKSSRQIRYFDLVMTTGAGIIDTYLKGTVPITPVPSAVPV